VARRNRRQRSGTAVVPATLAYDHYFLSVGSKRLAPCVHPRV
jgi:hypothetical protein